MLMLEVKGSDCGSIFRDEKEKWIFFCNFCNFFVSPQDVILFFSDSNFGIPNKERRRGRGIFT